jgi:PAS domain S-box-containing protein
MCDTTSAPLPSDPKRSAGARTFQENVLFRVLTEYSSDAMTLIDLEGTILYSTPTSRRVLGYEPNEFIGRSGFELVHPDDEQRIRGRLAELVHEPSNRITVEMRVRHKDSSWRWMECVGTNLLSEPSVHALAVSYRDVTERRRAHEALRERAEEIETLVELLPMGVFIAHDPECRRITGNRAGYEMLRQPVGTNLSQSAPAGEKPPFVAQREGRIVPPEELPMQCAARGMEVRDVEVEFVYSDGAVCNLFGSASPLYDSRGQVRGCVAAFLDITERKKLDAELRRRLEQLAEADRLKDEFLAMLGHELRNPLAPIVNALALLRSQAADASNAARARETVERQVQVLVRLVDDLLDVGRITRGKIQLHRRSVDLALVLCQAVESAHPLIHANDHHLAVSLPEGPIPVFGDPTRLEQVFANLLNNAAKYTEPGGSIRLEVERLDGEVVVRVHDNGLGIPGPVLPYVFDLFTQADRTLDRSQGGLGIGLTLVKALVEMHGGGVTAQSEGPGRGSEFTVRLPLSAAPVLAEETPGETEPAPSATSLRVLVVDDNKDAAESLGALLRTWGHSARTVHDGPSAIRVAHSWAPEVVLLDIGLPGMSGHEVARQLRQGGGEQAPVLVAVTGYGQEDDRLRSLEAGFDLHWIKPVEPEALRTLLTTVGTGRSPKAPE